MVESSELDSLLQTGSWAPSRSRSKSPGRPPNPVERAPAPATVRANQSSKIDRHVPRSFDKMSSYPPPPSVEDEAEALAKEHGASVISLSSAAEEEPKHRGDLEQHPILLPVHEYNPERRFVYVRPGSPDGDGSETSRRGAPRPEKEEYEANTCRKFTMPLRSDKKPSEKPEDATLGVRRDRARRRSELPRIETGLGSTTQSRNPSRDPSREPSPVMQRTRSATYIDQPRDYFDRQDSQGPPSSAGGYLSPRPSVIKHATNGRDRAYLDFNDRNGGGSDSRNRSTIIHNSQAGPDDRGSRRSGAGYDRTYYPAEAPDPHKRSSSTVDMDAPPARRPTEGRRDAEGRREKQYLGGYHKDAPDARSASSRKNVSPTRSERRHASPPRSGRRGESPPSRSHSLREPPRDKLERGNSTRKSQRELPSRDRDGFSGDEPRRSTRDRRKSFIVQDDSNYLLSPDSTQASTNGRPRSRHPTPLASPSASQSGFDLSLPPSPRPSVTFPVGRYSRDLRDPPEPRERERNRRRAEDRSVSPFSPTSKNRGLARLPDDDAPRRSETSRLPSLNTSMTSPAAMGAAVVGAGATAAAAFMGAPHIVNLNNAPIERRRSPMPPAGPLPPRHAPFSDPGPAGQSYWQPGPFAPPPLQSGFLDQPIVSYRRFSEDVSQGKVADLPLCPRQVPRPGFSDWLTFPMCNNFNICPDCYMGVFSRTEFAHAFVPVPFRPMDAPIACDFGSSPWYRIAWLMTRKARLPDLQLLQKIAAVDAKYQACAGDQRMTRVWQTVRNPADNQPVENFNVCSYCANAVQSLFPNLSGTFQTVDLRAEPTRGVCSLHFAPERRRFLLYFDVLEETSDRALSRNSSPDVSRLFERLRRISSSDCTRDEDQYDRKWYMMSNLDALTVCEECFEEVVQPEIADNNPLARKFYKMPQRLKGPTTCQLYSPRMRREFYEVCRSNDFPRLQASVEWRLDHENNIKDRIRRCKAHNHLGLYSDKIRALEEEWQRDYE